MTSSAPMNRYSQHLTYTLLATLFALPLGSFAAGLMIGFHGLVVASGDFAKFPEALGFAMSAALLAVLLGVLPALVYGAPVYAWLSRHHYANALTAIGVGALPGVLLLPSEPLFAGLVLLFGVCVSVTTHLLVRKRLAMLRQAET